MPRHTAQLLILGASARAAAQSARRAQQTVWSADLFADQDLQDCAETTHLKRYPTGFLLALAQAPPAPWLYTGALENYPRLVRRLAALRPLLGNNAETLQAVRDPLCLATELAIAGIAFPETHAISRTAVPREIPAGTESNRWLLKPRRSAAGKNIHLLSDHCSPVESGGGRKQETLLQRFIPGSPCAAVYVAANGSAALLGLTQQWIGWAELGAEGFTYCGSLGPVSLSAEQRTELLHIGHTLADRFALTGLFGVDLIQTTDPANQAERFVVIEVNPRYTASVELLERAFGYSAIAWHLAACLSGDLPEASHLASLTTDRWQAKGILFARQPAQFHARIADEVRQRNLNSTFPEIADIPAPGTALLPGHPVMTLFAESSTAALAQQALRKLASTFETLLYSPTNS